MRLTDDIMRASEEATADRIGAALALASTGRFGLIPSSRQFQVSLNLKPDSVEVQALDCLAVTRSGYLIDAQFDTRNNSHLENNITIPVDSGASELLLTIGVDPKRWKETINGYEEPEYLFSLVGVNSPIPDDALPIAHLIHMEQVRGWQIDEEDFLPPCLFVSAHWRYVELMNQFIQKLSAVENTVFQLQQPGAHEAFKIFWPVVQQILIDTDKNRDLMTPNALLGNIQKFVAIFTAACHLDQFLNLNDAGMFRNFALVPYNFMNVYPLIKEGLKYCFLIDEKVNIIANRQPERPKPVVNDNNGLEAPFIPDDQLYQNCKTSLISVPIVNNAPGATVYYSYDGSEPSKPASNGKIKIKNTFAPAKEPEPDQEYQVCLKAVLGDAESAVSTFTVVLHKDYKTWIKI